VNVVSYWMANLIWDLVKFIFTGIIVLIILWFWDFKELFYTQYGQLFSLLTGLLLFGIACFMFV